MIGRPRRASAAAFPHNTAAPSSPQLDTALESVKDPWNLKHVLRIIISISFWPIFRQSFCASCRRAIFYDDNEAVIRKMTSSCHGPWLAGSCESILNALNGLDRIFIMQSDLCFIEWLTRTATSHTIKGVLDKTHIDRTKRAVMMQRCVAVDMRVKAGTKERRRDVEAWTI